MNQLWLLLITPPVNKDDNTIGTHQKPLVHREVVEVTTEEQVAHLGQRLNHMEAGKIATTIFSNSVTFWDIRLETAGNYPSSLKTTTLPSVTLIQQLLQ